MLLDGPALNPLEVVHSSRDPERRVLGDERPKTAAKNNPIIVQVEDILLEKYHFALQHRLFLQRPCPREPIFEGETIELMISKNKEHTLVADDLSLEKRGVALVVDESANISSKDEVRSGDVEVEGGVLLTDFKVEVRHILKGRAAWCRWRGCPDP